MTLQEAKKLYNSDNEEIKAIALKYFTENELSNDILPVCWEDLKEVYGYFIAHNSVSEPTGVINASDYNINVFVSEKQAKSALAFAQLSQLAHRMNDGWEPDWENNDERKFTVHCVGGLFRISIWFKDHCHIAFKTEEIAKFSLQNHCELWKQYWMI